jgi:site-specific recombinase XerD
MYTYSKPVQALSSIRSASFVELVCDYERALLGSGYNPHVVRFHLHAVTHFGVWLELKGAGLGAIDEETVAAFEQHRSRCRCPAVSRNRRRSVVSCIRVFLHQLREQGMVPDAEPVAESKALVREFLQWLTAHRGSVETTRITYRLYVTNLIDFLGDDPQTYTAAGLRDFIAKRYRHYGHNSIRMVLAAVRMFLRYLAVEGRCRAGLEQALLSPATWSQQSLPQGLTPEEVARILMLCPSTSRGIRDRAVLLLLIRLGLRAGDVAALRLRDICFQTGTIKVAGKGSREVLLPLPQDVGDALLDYLRVGRPRVESDYVFLRSLAPFRPFGGYRPGSAVKYIAQTALQRAGIQRRRRGAHVFRHTAACAMLRADVGLERIAQVLRHRSIETTGIYAKVDFNLLRQVAQPWPEEALC